jgi:hypothetical protein
LGSFLQFFLAVVIRVFCWVFLQIVVGKRGVLRGKCGEVVVICVAGDGTQWPSKNGTGF